MVANQPLMDSKPMRETRKLSARVMTMDLCCPSLFWQMSSWRKSAKSMARTVAVVRQASAIVRLTMGIAMGPRVWPAMLASICWGETVRRWGACLAPRATKPM